MAEYKIQFYSQMTEKQLKLLKSKMVPALKLVCELDDVYDLEMRHEHKSKRIDLRYLENYIADILQTTNFSKDWEVRNSYFYMSEILVNELRKFRLSIAHFIELNEILFGELPPADKYHAMIDKITKYRFRGPKI